MRRGRARRRASLRPEPAVQRVGAIVDGRCPPLSSNRHCPTTALDVRPAAPPHAQRSQRREQQGHHVGTRGSPHVPASLNPPLSSYKYCMSTGTPRQQIT